VDLLAVKDVMPIIKIPGIIEAVGIDEQNNDKDGKTGKDLFATGWKIWL